MSHATLESNQPRLESVSCLSPAGLHSMAYWEWGDPDNDRVLLCVHGLTRTGRDFDDLARCLSSEFRVVCPDIVGRGQSSWLSKPSAYVVPQYVSDMMPLLGRLRARTLYWFGTSLGGLIGMALAGLAGSPIQKLVLNDVGPSLDPGALMRIGQYVGQAPIFDHFDEAVSYVRAVSASFGSHSDAQWRELTRRVVRQNQGEKGPWSMHYDPAIAQAFNAIGPELIAAGEVALWQAYTSITCPILIVHGALSDLLTEATVRKMLERNPHALRVDIPDVGHAPTFMSPDQLSIACEFLLEKP